MPENKEEFTELIKKKGLWDELSMVCYPRLNRRVLKDEIDKEIKDSVEVIKDFRISLSKRKDVEEE